MSAATLLNPNDPWFDFDHRKAHEAMLATILRKTNSSNFSGIPYWLDPKYGDTAVPAGWGNTLHAQAHADFDNLFPAQFGGTGKVDLNNIALNPEATAWEQFSNYRLHVIASQIS